jgi:hypothetical protein
MNRAIATFAVMLALSAVSLFAADVNGKWTAEYEGRNGKMTQTFNLKTEGDKLTGTVTSPRGENQISDGKVTGDQVTFNVKVEMGGETRVMKYTGKVEGNEIKFSVEGGQRSREYVAKRATS